MTESDASTEHNDALQAPAANAVQGGREINPRMLYVGELDRNVTEDMLQELFKSTGSLASVKVIADKNSRRRGLNYAFVEYNDEAGAKQALDTLHGRILNDHAITIKYGFKNQQAIKDTENYNLFIGDLSNEVDDDLLSNAFQQYPSLIEARVMWDMSTGRSRGYGFASFSNQQDAEQALREMDSAIIGSRPIRCNWAQKRGNIDHSNTSAYDLIYKQTPKWQTTVYVGNLVPFATAHELLQAVQNFGYIVDFKHQQDRGYAFVKYDSHENATMAITQLPNFQLHGRTFKCGWGRENRR